MGSGHKTGTKLHSLCLHVNSACTIGMLGYASQEFCSYEKEEEKMTKSEVFRDLFLNLYALRYTFEYFCELLCSICILGLGGCI